MTGRGISLTSCRLSERVVYCAGYSGKRQSRMGKGEEFQSGYDQRFLRGLAPVYANRCGDNLHNRTCHDVLQMEAC